MSAMLIILIIPLYAFLLFWYYWPTTLLLTMCARKQLSGKTTRLFFISCGIQWGISFALQLLVFGVVIPVLGTVHGPVLIGVLALAGFLGGLLGWVILLVKRLRRRSEVQAFRNRHPLPKQQCTMRDIYTAVFYFACAMAIGTLVINAAVGSQEEYRLALLGAYLLASTALGFYAALDVLRYKTATQNAWARSGIILFTVLFSSSTIFVGLLIAWRAWQRALLLTAMERERAQGGTESAGHGGGP